MNDIENEHLEVFSTQCASGLFLDNVPLNPGRKTDGISAKSSQYTLNSFELKVC